MRKTISKYIFIFAAIIAAVSSCQDIYKDEYEELALDYTRLNIKPEGGNFVFMVYYSGDWTIELDKDVSWARLEMNSGSGITPVHIDVDQNYSFKRSFNMIVEAGAERDTVVVTQSPAVENPTFRFSEESLALANGSGKVTVLLQSNLMKEAIDRIDPVIEYIQGEDWLRIVDVEEAADGYIVENGVAWYTYRVVLDVTANTSGEDRAAYVSYSLYDEDKDIRYSCEIAITQTALPGLLILRDKVILGYQQRI